MADSDAIVVVEGRSDVMQLLRSASRTLSQSRELMSPTLLRIGRPVERSRRSSTVTAVGTSSEGTRAGR